MIGSRIGRYEITAKLGEGGMGEVYRATDTTLGRAIALKILPPEMASDRERLARFHREARAAAAPNHPNVVTLFSVEESGGVHFLTTLRRATSSAFGDLASSSIAESHSKHSAHVVWDGSGASQLRRDVARSPE